MSGISAGLAYGNFFRPGCSSGGVSKVWKRVWTLYLVHLLVTAWALAIAAFFARAFNLPALLHANVVDWFYLDPLGFSSAFRC